ncbi:MAG: hypothetical protein L0Z55_06010 [Planctomycetes bacterium]|nr:hypothetical protein [Planctomycetota bacterium]
MKKLLLFALIVGGGFCVYKTVFAKSSAYRAYEAFADALLFDRWDEARELAASSEVAELVGDRSAAPEILGYQSYHNLKGRVHMGPFRSIELEEESEDGERVSLRVTQETREGPLTMAPVGPATRRYTHDAVLVYSGGTWLVESFAEETESLVKDNYSSTEE